MGGVNGVQGTNIHTIAIQVPNSDLTRNANAPTDVTDAGSVIGVWATRQPPAGADPQRLRHARPGTGRGCRSRGWATRCSTRSSCRWPRRTAGTACRPSADSQFAQYVTKPELAGLLPVLYPGVFPNLAAYTKPRADLAAILLTGIPAGVVQAASRTTPGRSRRTCCGSTWRCRRRPSREPARPGRPATRPASRTGAGSNDDVVTIEMRAIAGLTIPLVDPTFKPDATSAATRCRRDDGHQRKPSWHASRTSGTPGGGLPDRTRVPTAGA